MYVNVITGPPLVDEILRTHPWTVGDHDENCRYMDLKAQPDLIPDAIEDIAPFKEQRAIQEFAALLRWLNSPHVRLESNDCAFQPPHKNHNPHSSPKRLEADGRLMLLFRDLRLNCLNPYSSWLYEQSIRGFDSVDRSFEDGCVDVRQFRTAYVGINADGWLLHISFWAWGNSEDEVWRNLGRLFKNAGEVLFTLDSFIPQPTKLS